MVDGRVLFDTGAIYVDPEGIVRLSSTHAEFGKLREVAGRRVASEHFAYHREHHTT